MNFMPTIVICVIGTLYLLVTTGISLPTIIGVAAILFVLFNSGGDPTAPWNKK